jgi:hypothetical protein
MKKNLLAFIACVFIFEMGYAQFQTSYGTPRRDQAFSVQSTRDLNYILSGETDSTFFGLKEATLTKISPLGAVLWSYVYGGINSESYKSVRQVPTTAIAPVSYVTTGYTNSFGVGGFDVLLTGVNVAGIPVFSTTFGGSKTDRGNNVQVITNPTGAPGYIIAGETSSFPFGTATGFNFYVIQTDAMGFLTGSVVIGGPGDERANWIEQTSDGGYIVVGQSSSPILCTTAGVAPNLNIFVVKLNPDLTVAWSRTIGDGPNVLKNDVAYSVKETPDRDFIVTGYTESYGSGSQDIFLLNLRPNGAFNWFKTYGRRLSDRAFSIIIERAATVPASYNYIVTGSSQNYNLAGNTDAITMKTNSTGVHIWTRKFGSSNFDGFNEVAHNLSTTSGGYIMAGRTNSYGAGSDDKLFALSNSFGVIDGVCDRYVTPITKIYQTCMDPNTQFMKVNRERRIQISYKPIEYKRHRCTTISMKSTDDEELLTEEAGSGLLVSPNPTSSDISLTYPEELAGATVQVINTKGVIVYKGKLEGNSQSQIPAQDLPEGLYIISIISNDNKITNTKFIKK